MKEQEQQLPMSTVALVLGALSIPLAFAGQLCSLALVLGLYGLGLGAWGQRQARRHLLRYTPGSVRRGKLGVRLAAVGTLCAVAMWALWASNVLLN
jgi:hypothetical protein